MPEDGQREPVAAARLIAGGRERDRRKQNAGGESPAGDDQDHAGTPLPDALIPALDEGQLAALREIGARVGPGFR